MFIALRMALSVASRWVLKSTSWSIFVLASAADGSSHTATMIPMSLTLFFGMCPSRTLSSTAFATAACTVPIRMFV